MSVHVLGIRHHGPGSSRALIAALDAVSADCVLIEGPPDADEVVPLAAHAEMAPPIALLVYATEAPARAAFYPFAEYSPEWQAMRWALARGVPVRFMDLPQAHQLDAATYAREDEDEDEARDEVAADPLGALAQAAGYEDRELWWELHVEQRRDPTGVFEGILEAMTALREDRPITDLRERRREAFMRRTIRAAERAQHRSIAVVCGAWHAPALATRAVPVKEDDAILKGLPKTKVTATWVPWSRARLAAKSGYGAGVRSPGWYAHLWASRDRVAERWLTEVARLFRGEGLDAPPASVIEAVRLADALAALRDRAMPGLEELNEAARAVLAHGEAAKLALVRERLEVGTGLGAVPAETPMVPLARDLAAQQKALRLKVSAEPKTLDLDLRGETDRARSRLLHRLALLGVRWGQIEDVESAGTFKERWTLRWDPELAVAVVEANVHGNTVDDAAASAASERAAKLEELGELTALLDLAVLAELPRAVDRALARVGAVAAVAADARTLLAALPPLARAARWGDVRGTPRERLLPVIDALFARALIGLPGAAASLDDDAAAAMRGLLTGTTEALRLLDREEPLAAWYDELARLMDRDGVHGLVRGASARLLLEAGRIDEAALAARARLALSVAAPPAQAAAWVEGVLGAGAALHLAHDALWVALDGWLTSLDEAAFVELLPLVRRAFAGLPGPERRRLADRLLALGGGGRATAVHAEAPVDEARAARVAPVIRRILGLEVTA